MRTTTKLAAKHARFYRFAILVFGIFFKLAYRIVQSVLLFFCWAVAMIVVVAYWLFTLSNDEQPR